MLLMEVQADRDTLQRLAGRVGSGLQCVKGVRRLVRREGRWAKVRARIQGKTSGTFEALEFLALGVRGKLGMWQALDVVAAGDAQFQRV